MMTAQSWIDRLGLQPHPEGGFFAETYRAEMQVTTDAGERTGACTSIHYLLEAEDYSGFHRLSYPEIWYFHDGVPLHIHMIDPAGTYARIELGRDGDGHLSVVVEPGVWFAAEIPSRTLYALVSCAVAPAFDFAAFEMADRDAMLRTYPQHADVLHRLCRPSQPPGVTPNVMR